MEFVRCEKNEDGTVTLGGEGYGVVDDKGEIHFLGWYYDLSMNFFEIEEEIEEFYLPAISGLDTVYIHHLPKFIGAATGVRRLVVSRFKGIFSFPDIRQRFPDLRVIKFFDYTEIDYAGLNPHTVTCSDQLLLKINGSAWLWEKKPDYINWEFAKDDDGYEYEEVDGKIVYSHMADIERRSAETQK